MADIPLSGEDSQPQKGARRRSADSVTVPGMGNALKRLRTARGWTHDQAAERMGVSRGHFIKLENGERKLNERTIRLAAKAFTVSPAQVLNEAEDVDAASDRALGPDIPVYAAAEAGDGAMIISTDPVEYVPRPWYLKNVKHGYAVLISGNSMAPAYEPGDMAVVNPRLPPVPGKDVILVSHERRGEFTGRLKRMRTWTEKDWFVEQFNPPPGQESKLALSRREWPKALRVVGKFSG
jgi:transcriptional regulator with XRE-family HTH domain